MLAILMLLSCVYKGDFELVEVQLDATRTALSAKNAACYEDIQEREGRVASLQQELSRLQEQHAALTDRHLQLSEEVQETRQALAELATCPSVPQEDVEDGGAVAPLEPLVKATREQVVDALTLRSRVLYEARQRRRAHERILARFKSLQDERRLDVLVVNGHTVIRIPVTQLFNEGRVTISPRGEVLLQGLAEALTDAADAVIQVGAHTDDQPHHTADYNSAWELGFDQAMTVLRSLQHAGVTARLNAASFGASQPIASNDSADGRKLNQRVELVFDQDLTSLPGMTVLGGGDRVPPEPLPGE